MKQKKIPFLFMASAAILGLASCNIYDLIAGLSSSQNSSASNGVSHDSSWQPAEDILPCSLKSLSNTVGMDYLPSQGEVRLLVLPIEFTDCPFSTQTLKDLDVALNGTAEETGYWESLSSFYEKSSFGKSKLSFEIADVYSTGLGQKEAWSAQVEYSGGEYTSDNGVNYIHQAYSNYISKNGSSSTKQFDSDGNGWIDGIIAVYSGKDCTNLGTNNYDCDANYYWAYTYWTRGYCTGWNNPNPSCPTPNLYFWMSYDFIYDAVNSPKVDAHTLIHETGHMYGLNDYYPTGGSSKRLAGTWDMMDGNILDHDVYSKMMLGWIKPTIVTDSEEISINPSASSGDCLLLPTGSWNGTAYDEYMLLELYTPTNLNELDSQTAYVGRLKGYTIPGIKLYHIDSRLIQIQQDRFGNQAISYVTDPVNDIHWSGTSQYAYGYEIGASNAKKTGYVDGNFALIHMIEGDNVFEFNAGGYGENKDLFSTGYSFSLQNYKKFFTQRSATNQATMNNGADFPFTLTFNEVASDHATISITKTNN